jgi:hypothetical protein
MSRMSKSRFLVLGLVFAFSDLVKAFSIHALESADSQEHSALGVRFVAERLGDCIVDGSCADQSIDQSLGGLSSSNEPSVGLDVSFVGIGKTDPDRDPAGDLQTVDAMAE